MASSSLRTSVASASRSLSLPRAAVLVPNRSLATEAPLPKASYAEEWEVPEIHLGPTHSPRYREHYHSTLSSDLLYMAYNHKLSRRPPRKPAAPVPQTLYEANRPGPNKALRPRMKALTPNRVPELESIVMHTMVKSAIGNKAALLPAIQALRAISGDSVNGGGRSSSGVQIVKAKTGAANFKLREGMPIAAKVEMKGDAMYDFVQSLADFVLPRIREFPGVPIAPNTSSQLKSNLLSGVVSFGLPPAALGLFPQIEANLDTWSQLYGFHIYFKTNQKGEGAEFLARALLSGMRVPFYRK